MFFYVKKEGESAVSDGQRQVRPVGNISEWTAFFCLITGVMVLALSFHHDNCNDEIYQFWAKNIKISTPRHQRKRKNRKKRKRRRDNDDDSDNDRQIHERRKSEKEHGFVHDEMKEMDDADGVESGSESEKP